MTIRPAVLTKFPPLHARKHPGVAALIGAVTGGLGLAIYFKSLRDLFPVELAGGVGGLVSLLAGGEPLQGAPFPLPGGGGPLRFFCAPGSQPHPAAPHTS